MATLEERRAQRQMRITDFAILEASAQLEAEGEKKLKFSRADIAKLLGVAESTLKLWEYEADWKETMHRAGGRFSRIRIVFELEAIAKSQETCIDVDLQRAAEDRGIDWKERRQKWKKNKTFKKRVKFYQALPASDRAKEQRFWTDRFNKEAAEVKMNVKTEVQNIQIRYAIDHIMRLLQTPEELDAFFRAIEQSNLAKEEAVMGKVEKAARRAQMRTVELIKALEDRVPAVLARNGA